MPMIMPGQGGIPPGVNPSAWPGSPYFTPPPGTGQLPPPASPPAQPPGINPNNLPVPGGQPRGFMQHPGFNPMQFASAGMTQSLGELLGGMPAQIPQTQGPYAIPPQNMLRFGPHGSYNAGLLNNQMMRPWANPARTSAQLRYNSSDAGHAARLADVKRRAEAQRQAYRQRESLGELIP